MNFTHEEIENLRDSVMWIVDRLAQVESWPAEQHDIAMYVIRHQPWYALFPDQAYFRECLRAAQPPKGASI